MCQSGFEKAKRKSEEIYIPKAQRQFIYSIGEIILVVLAEKGRGLTLMKLLFSMKYVPHIFKWRVIFSH